MSLRCQLMSDRQLIGKIQYYDCLTNKNSVGYNLLHVKNAAWKEISHEIEKSVEYCKSRFLALAERYFIEKAKFPDNGMARQSWGLYIYMRRLEKHILRRNLRVTKSEPIASELAEDDENYCLTACDVFFKNMNTSPASGSPKELSGSPKERTNAEIEKVSDNVQNITLDKNTPKMDYEQATFKNINEITKGSTADDIFGRFVAAELKDINDLRKKRDMKTQIASLLLNDK